MRWWRRWASERLIPYTRFKDCYLLEERVVTNPTIPTMPPCQEGESANARNPESD